MYTIAGSKNNSIKRKRTKYSCLKILKNIGFSRHIFDCLCITHKKRRNLQAQIFSLALWGMRGAPKIFQILFYQSSLFKLRILSKQLLACVQFTLCPSPIQARGWGDPPLPPPHAFSYANCSKFHIKNYFREYNSLNICPLSPH
jgi:hypothetical protein